MAIVIRMSRQGRRNRPHYRLGVFDRRTRRDGPPIEHLGHYDPRVEEEANKVKLDEERIRYWLSVGADVSDTVRSFLRKRGIETPAQAPTASKKGKKKAAN
ncbi:MAG: 30S ribosomal protein S16 [Planctomycetota bacterium]|nr:30S ribosomal protein S16 [Planctomycetota bacterium]